MRVLSLSLTALIMSAGLAAAQVPMQAPPGGGTDPRAGEGRRQQDGGAERMERRERRQEDRAQRQDVQPERAGQREDGRAERRWDGDRSAPTVRVERDRDDRYERRPDIRYDRRVVVRDRGPDVYIRTLPVRYRTVFIGGRPCRITITRRMRANGRIVTTETRRCSGRPAVVIQTRR